MREKVILIVQVWPKTLNTCTATTKFWDQIAHEKVKTKLANIIWVVLKQNANDLPKKRYIVLNKKTNTTEEHIVRKWKLRIQWMCVKSIILNNPFRIRMRYCLFSVLNIWNHLWREQTVSYPVSRVLCKKFGVGKILVRPLPFLYTSRDLQPQPDLLNYLLLTRFDCKSYCKPPFLFSTAFILIAVVLIVWVLVS